MTGAEVETAENGKIAVEKVEASPKGLYDLIFMDIQMPVMNGYEATAAIRSLPGEKGKLPIVAMTANAFAEDVQLAKNTGMNGHIAKPLDMNKLNDVCSVATRRKLFRGIMRAWNPFVLFSSVNGSIALKFAITSRHTG